MKKVDTGECSEVIMGADEFERFFEGIHELQSPETFSTDVQRIGWHEHTLPKRFSDQVIRRIQRDNITEHCDWRVLLSAFGIFSLLCTVVIVSAGRIAIPLTIAGQLQFASGLFWLVFALTVTAGIFSITVMRYAQKKETLPNHG